MNAADRKTATIERACRMGSRATTIVQAVRYLIKKLPAPIAGLVTAGTPAFQPRAARRRDESLWNSHTVRAARRAATVANSAAASDEPFIELQRLVARFTPDVARQAPQALYLELASQVERRLTDAWPYRRSTSGWAGGEHAVAVKIGPAPSANGCSDKVWSNNGKWSGTNSYAGLTVTTSCLDALRGDTVIGGLVTLDCEQVGPREFRAAWAEQSRGFDLKVVHGWLIRGYHVAGGTLNRARKIAAEARRSAAERLLAARARGGLPPDLRGIAVRREDSLAAGNCAAGTDSFIRSVDGLLAGRKEVPATELLALRNDVHTQRAVMQARRRIGGQFPASNEAKI